MNIEKIIGAILKNKKTVIAISAGILAVALVVVGVVLVVNSNNSGEEPTHATESETAETTLPSTDGTTVLQEVEPTTPEESEVTPPEESETVPSSELNSTAPSISTTVPTISGGTTISVETTRPDEPETTLPDETSPVSPSESESDVVSTDVPAEMESEPQEDFALLTYAEYIALSGVEQEAYFNKFEDIDAFFAWYNAAKEEWENSQSGSDIIIGGDETLDLGDLLG